MVVGCMCRFRYRQISISLVWPGQSSIFRNLTVEVRLAVIRGNNVTREISLRRFPATVGRHTECSLRVSSRLVSREHCEISTSPAGVVVRDLNSSNGTFVNGTRIIRETTLQPGDLLEVGPVKFQVEYQVPVSGEETIMDSSRQGDETLSERPPRRTPQETAEVHHSPDGEIDEGDTAVDQRYFLPKLSPQEELAASFFEPLEGDAADGAPAKPPANSAAATKSPADAPALFEPLDGQ